MSSKSAPDFDGMTVIFENETTSKFSIGLQEGGAGAPLALKVIFNPPLRWNVQQQGGNFQG